MLGELHPVWPETWAKIWTPLSRQREAPPDLWTSLFSGLIRPPVPPVTPDLPTEFDAGGYPAHESDLRAQRKYQSALVEYQLLRSSYEDVATGSAPAKPALRAALPTLGATESTARETLQSAYDIVESYNIEVLSNKFFNLTMNFIRKFNLRYDLRRPFTFHPTPAGVYAKLFSEIVSCCRQDASLSALLRDYLEAFQDLNQGATSGRINTCLQKHVNLLEGLTSVVDGVTATTLGKMCNEVNTWPSTAVSEAAKTMYGFASDHTGLRHGTIKKAKEGRTPIVHRDMEMRDLIAVSAFFTGMTAYLSDRIDPTQVYGL